jgi:hypothetical protein
MTSEQQNHSSFFHTLLILREGGTFEIIYLRQCSQAYIPVARCTPAELTTENFGAIFFYGWPFFPAKVCCCRLSTCNTDTHQLLQHESCILTHTLTHTTTDHTTERIDTFCVVSFWNLKRRFGNVFTSRRAKRKLWNLKFWYVATAATIQPCIQIGTTTSSCQFRG